MTRVRYGSLYERLVANTYEPENDLGCWTWKGRRDRWGYGHVNVRVDGKHCTFKAHLLMACITSSDEPLSLGEVVSLYRKRAASGDEHDHVCVNPSCINPDHLEYVTASVNCQRRNERRALAA